MARRGIGGLHVEHIPINSGGYDSRGRYWGTGAKLYRVTNNDDSIDVYVRASSAKDARKSVAAANKIVLPSRKRKGSVLKKITEMS